MFKNPHLLFPVSPLVYQISQWYGKPKTEQLKQWYAELGLFDESGNPIHNGIDFACPEGTKIIATHSGVVDAYVSSDEALITTITNKNLGIKTIYIHLSEFIKKTGDIVLEGDVIGLSGNSGKYTTGAHLHYGVYPIDEKGNYTYKFAKSAVNPAPYTAIRYHNGTLVKTMSEPKVYLILGGTKWWIKDEDTFEKYVGYGVGKAKIDEIDLISYNAYEYGEISYFKR